MKHFNIILLIIFFVWTSSFEAVSQQYPERPEIKVNNFKLGLRFLKLGNTYRESNNYELSQKYLLKGFDIIKKSNDIYWLAVAYEFLGYYYRDIEQRQKAKELLIKSREYFNKIIKQVDGSPHAIKEVLGTLNNTDEFPKYQAKSNEKKNLLLISKLYKENRILRDSIRHLLTLLGKKQIVAVKGNEPMDKRNTHNTLYDLQNDNDSTQNITKDSTTKQSFDKNEEFSLGGLEDDIREMKREINFYKKIKNKKKNLTNLNQNSNNYLLKFNNKINELIDHLNKLTLSLLSEQENIKKIKLAKKSNNESMANSNLANNDNDLNNMREQLDSVLNQIKYLSKQNNDLKKQLDAKKNDTLIFFNDIDISPKFSKNKNEMYFKDGKYFPKQKGNKKTNMINTKIDNSNVDKSKSNKNLAQNADQKSQGKNSNIKDKKNKVKNTSPISNNLKKKQFSNLPAFVYDMIMNGENNSLKPYTIFTNDYVIFVTPQEDDVIIEYNNQLDLFSDNIYLHIKRNGQSSIEVANEIIGEYIPEHDKINAVFKKYLNVFVEASNLEVEKDYYLKNDN